ncbi:MAG TPA: hypothetical protein VHZ73_10095 [Vicinamibacterales bacterium]|jgi:hypothetical protein|nr:hypothetical protein [Vicinamibacterales bacterium]
MKTPRSTWLAAVFAAIASLAAGVTSTCRRPEPVLTQLAEARARAGDLLIQFNKAIAAADGAVLADTDAASASAASEDRQARSTLERDSDRLAPLLQNLGYSPEIGLLDEFTRRYKDYKALDDSLLGLAVENTNIKAQRLAFGPQRETAETFRTAAEAAVRDVPSAQAPKADAAAARAEAALLDAQLLEARHNAEADEATMTTLEAQMTQDEAIARARLNDLTALRPGGAGRQSLTAAAAALDRFAASQTEIVQLSRRNTNVRSTALALGRKHSVGVGCEDILNQLADALSHHEFGTR